MLQFVGKNLFVKTVLIIVHRNVKAIEQIGAFP